MKRMNWQAVRAAFVFLTGLAVASMLNAQSNQKPHPENNPTPLAVSVVNTPTVNVGTLPAVTVGGTVNIGNTVPVQVTNPVQPPSSVTINNTAAQPVPAQVANTRSTPIPIQDVDNPARHPLQVLCQAKAPDQFGAFSCSMPAVPSNMEFVIQTVSFSGTGTQVGTVSIVTTGGGTSLATFVPVVQTSTSFFNALPLTQYADPGTSPSCEATINTSAVAGSMQCDLIGYLVSLP